MVSPLTMHECDLLVLSGTDFPYDKFLPTKPKIAQVDIRVDNLGRRSKLDLPLWAMYAKPSARFCRWWT
jgi:thiamine pyrophosphate-dependent acetolactate synthase large subunit-like protein